MYSSAQEAAAGIVTVSRAEQAGRLERICYRTEDVCDRSDHCG